MFVYGLLLAGLLALVWLMGSFVRSGGRPLKGYWG